MLKEKRLLSSISKCEQLIYFSDCATTIFGIKTLLFGAII